MSKRAPSRKDDEAPEPVPVAKRPRRPSSRAVDQMKVCQELYEILRTQKTDGGRLLCQAFIRAPSRRNCPAYYEVVKIPIDLMKIHGKLKAEEYESVDELMADVQLMVENAKAFYKRHCQEYQDALEIWELLSSTKARLMVEEDSRSESSAPARSRDPSPAPSNRSLRSNSPGRSSKCKEPGPSLFTGADPLDRSHLEELLAAVLTYTDESGRLLCEPFKLLPSPELYPEYYTVIKEAIDLRTICDKLIGNQYRTLNELEKDLTLMCRNAKTFNEPSSLIYKDACAIRKLVTTKKAEILDNAMTPVSKIRSKQSLQHICEVAKLQSSYHPAPLPSTDFGEDDSESADDMDLNNPFWKLYAAVRNCKDEANETHITNPFCQLPDRKYYPDYYEEIKDPMSLFMIKRRIRIGAYSSLEQMCRDMNQMFENAKSYNIEGSQIYETACFLQGFVAKQRQRLESGLEIEHEVEKLRRPASKCQQPLEGVASKPRKRSGPSESSADKIKHPRKSVDDPYVKYKSQLRSLLTAIDEYREPITGRKPVEAFRHKPSKKLYPDYYQVIPEPTDLTTITANLDSDKYTSLQAIVSDLELMFNNAKHYNEPDSQIYNDASVLSCIMKNVANGIGPLEIPKAGRDKSANGRSSSASRSSQSTPRSRTVDIKKRPEEDPTKKKLWSLFETVQDYMDHRGRKLSSVFMKLPVRAEYPDYYDVIKKPIDMSKIECKLKKNEYHSLDGLVQDFCLMFDNACRYNDPESLIYKDSLTLQSVVLEKKSELKSDADTGFPNVKSAVQELLTRLFIEVFNHMDEEGRCYSDSIGEIPELLKASDPDKQVLSLDDVKQNLDKRRYRRLDRFQEDMFQVFETVREVTRTDSQAFEDAVELQNFFIRKRDEITSKGERLLSPALAYTEKHLSAAVEAERKEKEPKEKLEDSKTSPDPHCRPTTHKDSDTELQKITLGDQVYSIGEFCYVKPAEEDQDRRAEHHILRIERIWLDNSLKQTFCSGKWFYRPHETFHLATRKFLEKEVFKTPFYDQVAAPRLAGKCYVMFIKDYFNFRPKGFADEHVYVCESSYLGRVRHFKKIKYWDAKEEGPEVVLETRETVLEPVRVSSAFVRAQSTTSQSTDASRPEQVDPESSQGSDEESNASILDREREIVEQDNAEGDSSSVYYEQVQYKGTWFKLGDGIYTTCVPDQEVPTVVRIEKMWKNASGEYYARGPIFARPAEVEHEPTRMFYKRELFLTSREEIVHMDQFHGKCYFMVLKDFCTYRPTEYAEEDVYLIESKLYSQGSFCASDGGGGTESLLSAEGSQAGTVVETTRKLQKLTPLKLSTMVLDDEFFYFYKAIVPEKEASPLLAQVEHEKHEIDIDALLADMDFGADIDLSGISGISGISSTSTPKLGFPVSKEKIARTKSGYILYSAEVRKRIMSENPTSGFGEISRLVGQEWRNLSEDKKKDYEEKAIELSAKSKKAMAEAEARGDLLQAYMCRWKDCYFMFETSDQLFQHITGPSGHAAQSEVEGKWHCHWQTCLKYKKEGKPFQKFQLLVRHVKDKHMPSALKPIPPSQKARIFVPAKLPPVESSHQDSSSASQSPNSYSNQGAPGIAGQDSQSGVSSHTDGLSQSGLQAQAAAGIVNAQPLVVYQVEVPSGAVVGGHGSPMYSTAVVPPSAAYGPHASLVSQQIQLPIQQSGEHSTTYIQQATIVPQQPPAQHPAAHMPSQLPAVSHGVPPEGPGQSLSVMRNTTDPGSLIVEAPKPPRPVFVPPPESAKVQRALHSNAYLQYIESLSNPNQTTVSRFDRSLATFPSTTSKVRKVSRPIRPSDWLSRYPDSQEDTIKALWALRDELLCDTLNVARQLNG